MAIADSPNDEPNTRVLFRLYDSTKLQQICLPRQRINSIVLQLYSIRYARSFVGFIDFSFQVTGSAIGVCLVSSEISIALYLQSETFPIKKWKTFQFGTKNIFENHNRFSFEFSFGFPVVPILYTKPNK